MTLFQGDFYSLTTNDGQVLTLPSQDIAGIDIGGFGAPPVQWITKQGYKQHGETEVGYILQKRQIDIKLHYNRAPNRYQYWKNRALIHDFLRHNRLGPLTLTIQMSGDATFDVGNYLKSGNTVATFNQSNSPQNKTLYVSSTAGFQINMAIRIDSEYEIVTAVNASNNTLSVLRAQNNSAIGTHTIGTAIFWSPVSLASRKRSIIVRADPGLILPPDDDREANWNINEALKFIAFNPIWFDPVQNTITIAQQANQNLVFPITFPIVFGVGGLQFSQTIAYAGSWYEYPTVTLTGPYDSAIIQNTTTGVSFSMSVPLAAGNQRIITTIPGNLSVVDQNGASFFNELGPNSDLVDFNLRAAPEVTNGVNTFQVNLVNASGAAGATIAWYNRYFGI